MITIRGSNGSKKGSGATRSILATNSRQPSAGMTQGG